jgi:IclR family mhp operon transcriptional activator
VLKAMTIEQAAQRYLPPLQRFAATIEQGIREREQAGPVLA